MSSPEQPGPRRRDVLKGLGLTVLAGLLPRAGEAGTLERGDESRRHVEDFYRRQFSVYDKHKPGPDQAAMDAKWMRLEGFFQKEVNAAYERLASSVGRGKILDDLASALDPAAAKLGEEVKGADALSPAERFKLALSIVLILKDAVYQRDTRNVFGQIGLSADRARLQCDSGSLVSIASALSMSPDAISSIEEGGRLVFVRSAVGPHMQWGIWKGSGASFELRLFESTAFGVASATLSSRAELRQYHIQSVLDARDQMRILGEGTQKTEAALAFYSDDLPDEIVDLPKGDLAIEHMAKGALTPNSQDTIARLTGAGRAHRIDDLKPRE